ncbi:uncharacterized protein LOC144862270 [Branchiostoma floridae x Branchiostoma japonicum]
MASGHDLSEEIQEDILSCPICYHQLTEPKALPCQHTYCCKCLQELARRAKNGQFQCPECGKTVAIPTGGVEAFPTNFLVANVLDKVQQCKEEKKKQADETDMCDIHKQEAQVVCDDCNVVVCNVCLKSGHKGHVLKHIDQEKAIWVEKARRLIVESGEVSAGLSHQESHTLVKQRLQEKHEEIRKQIESRAAAVIHTVQRQKKNLLQELQQRQERKLEKISQRETQCERLIDMMLDGRTRAEEAINNNRPLLYNDISSHCLGLASAVSEGIAYRAKYSPLQEEVCGLRFESSSVELGHFVEGSVEVSPYHGTHGSSSNTDQLCLNGAKIHGNKSEKNPGKKVTFASHPVTAVIPSGSNERENSTLIILDDDDDDDDALNSNRTAIDHQKPASRKRKPWPKSPLSDLALTQLVKASCSRDSDPPAITESSANTIANSNGDNSVQKVPHRLTSLVTELRGRLDTKTGNSNGDNTAQMAAEGLASELPERRGTKAATGDSIGDQTVQKVAQAKRAARKLLETQGTKNTARKTVRSVNSTSWRPGRYMKPQVEIMRMQTEGNVATASASRANGASASTSASASISAPTYASASTSSPASSSASTSSPASSSASTSSPASSSASTSSPASTSSSTTVSTSASTYARTPASASTFASTSTSASMSTPASASASTSSSVAAHPGASRAGPYSSAKDKNGKRPVKKLRLSCSDKEHWFVKTKVEHTSDDDDDN